MEEEVLKLSRTYNKVAVFSVSYETASWKYVFASMAAYALQPFVLPIMILFSKLLKRELEWFPVYTNAG